MGTLDTLGGKNELIIGTVNEGYGKYEIVKLEERSENIQTPPHSR